ncbi:MAG: hypothetical protein RL199_2200, partial [Pseudomonadota bacterium]
MRRLLQACAVATFIGCSAIVDWSADGLPCDADGGCRDGYVCTASKVC